MRKSEFLFLVGSAGCSGARPATDSAAVATPPPVQGAPVIPSTLVPADSGRTTAVAVPGARPAPARTPATTVTDSARGTVMVTGTSFEKRVVVASGPQRTEITGPQAPVLARVAGAVVTVRGTRSGRTLEATDFTVRSVDDLTAIDGVLEADGASLVIVTTDGKRTTIVNAPPPLRERIGKRVWITGSPAVGIASFGYIDPPLG